jgi:hypothetical protein
MEALANLMIATVDLVEAEGRALRRQAVRFLWTVALILVASVMGAVGVGFVLAGLYWLLSAQLSAPEAAILFGIIALALAGAIAWIAHGLMRN